MIIHSTYGGGWQPCTFLCVPTLARFRHPRTVGVVTVGVVVRVLQRSVRILD